MLFRSKTVELTTKFSRNIELKVPFVTAAMDTVTEAKMAIGIGFAIPSNLVKRDVDTAGQTMFLLNVGELLEDYTRAMSENELINSLLDVPDKAQKVVGDTEVSVAATELEPGDLVAVRTGMSICIDGVVEQGSAMVNQATLTGEPLAVERSEIGRASCRERV